MLIEENIPKFFYIISQFIDIDVNDVFNSLKEKSKVQ